MRHIPHVRTGHSVGNVGFFHALVAGIVFGGLLLVVAS